MEKLKTKIDTITETNTDGDNSLLKFVNKFSSYTDKLHRLHLKLLNAFEREGIQYEIDDFKFKEFGFGYKFTFNIVSDHELPKKYVNAFKLKLDNCERYRHNQDLFNCTYSITYF